MPSREDIPFYEALKEEVDQLVGEISGEFSHEGCSPIRYEYGQWDREKLLAHYRAARVALVTPLQDGMNLVAKEYFAANIDEEGVLVLSEHAGTASQLHSDVILVNPYHIEELATAIHEACSMGKEERKARMSRLREVVFDQDIYWWTESFLRAAREKPIRRERRWPRRPTSRMNPLTGLSLPGRGLHSPPGPGAPDDAASGGGDEAPANRLSTRRFETDTRTGDRHGHE